MTDFQFYPPVPSGGANAIGRFKVGISSIGTLIPFNWRDTVISQFANSDILLQLISNLDAYFDQTANFEAFFDLIWNLDSAQGVGIDIWGRIVGVDRIIAIPITVTYFGFNEALPGIDTFGVQTFYNSVTLTSSYALSDDAYKRLIIAKAAANLTNGSIPAINQILLNLFPHRGNCYVIETSVPHAFGSYFGFSEQLNASGFGQQSFYSGQAFVAQSMQMQYIFHFPLTPVELAIVQSSGVLPRSTGVASSVLVLG